MTLKQLIQDKREDILQIATKHGAFNVRVFGSVARGEETENSDIDFLIDYDLAKTSPWFPGGLLVDLEDLLGCKVDVVTEESLHHLIKQRVSCTFGCTSKPKLCTNLARAAMGIALSMPATPSQSSWELARVALASPLILVWEIAPFP